MKPTCYALIPPFFLNYVVALGLLLASGSISEKRWLASGFVYAKKVPNGYTVFLVTNSHVVTDIKKALASPGDAMIGGRLPAKQVSPVLRFNPQAGQPAQELPLEMGSFFQDKGLDVAVSPFDIKMLDRLGIKHIAAFISDKHAADRSKAREIRVSEGDGVLDFPIWDQRPNR